jgi:hypothetical protein
MSAAPLLAALPFAAAPLFVVMLSVRRGRLSLSLSAVRSGLGRAAACRGRAAARLALSSLRLGLLVKLSALRVQRLAFGPIFFADRAPVGFVFLDELVQLLAFGAVDLLVLRLERGPLAADAAALLAAAARRGSAQA